MLLYVTQVNCAPVAITVLEQLLSTPPVGCSDAAFQLAVLRSLLRLRQSRPPAYVDRFNRPADLSVAYNWLHCRSPDSKLTYETCSNLAKDSQRVVATITLIPASALLTTCSVEEIQWFARTCWNIGYVACLHYLDRDSHSIQSLDGITVSRQQS